MLSTIQDSNNNLEYNLEVEGKPLGKTLQELGNILDVNIPNSFIW